MSDEDRKARHRREWLWKAFRLRTHEVDQMVEAQDNKCAICQDEFSAENRACVDHDHKSGAIRGMLCHHCNTGLGLFRDQPERLAAAIQYLEDS